MFSYQKQFQKSAYRHLGEFSQETGTTLGVSNRRDLIKDIDRDEEEVKPYRG